MGKKGGKRPGAGRKRGGANQATLEKRKVNEIYAQKIMKSVDVFYESQMTLARGINYLYKVSKKWIGKGDDRKLIQYPPERVTKQEDIEEYLQNVVSGVSEKESGITYFFITTKAPDAGVIENMLNRSLGSAAQIHKFEDESGKSIPIGNIVVNPLTQNKK